MKKLFSKLVLVIMVLFAFNLSAQKEISGDSDIDSVIAEVKKEKTTESNFRERHLMLYMWLGALQQQGANTVSFYDLDKKYYQLERVVNKSKSFFEMSTAHENEKTIADNKQSRAYQEAMLQMCETIDKGFEHMEEIQKELTDNGPIFNPFEGETKVTGGDMSADWPMFQANKHNNGSTTAPGPSY